jgi:hypothetical protein
MSVKPVLARTAAELSGKGAGKADPVMAGVETVTNFLFKYLCHEVPKRLIDATEEKAGEDASF